MELSGGFKADWGGVGIRLGERRKESRSDLETRLCHLVILSFIQ